jgi:opacity protein-like surface antigen
MHRGVFALALKAFCLSACLLVVGAVVPSAPSLAQNRDLVGASSGSATGMVDGVQGGYDWQRGPAVFGLTADFSTTSLDGSAIGGFTCTRFRCSDFAPLIASTSSSVDWYGTVRGRAGWANGPILVYATGGLAYGKVDLAGSFSASGLFSGAQASAEKIGWVLGGGVEYRLQGATLSLGYQYVDLGTISLATPAPPSPVCCDGFLTQSASARARFQAVTLGLSWKLASMGASGLSKPWDGGYLGGHFGGLWGNDTIGNFFGFFFSCFTGSTPVLMADGTTRPIAAVKIGDAVLGENGQINRVVAIETPPLGTRKLYALNDGAAFVTAEHPFMTRMGWKSIAPDATLAENHGFAAGKLEVGDELVELQTVAIRAKPMSVALDELAPTATTEVLVETRFSTIRSIASHDGYASMTLYNLRLDGNHTYFANNYLVHNK